MTSKWHRLFTKGKYAAATADEEGASKEIEISEEPSNLELREMLVDIQFKKEYFFPFVKDKMLIFISQLQETYSEPGDENIWKKEWGGELIFSHGTKHSKGVCNLINPTMQLLDECLYSNNSGRIVLITISLNGQKVTLCNIYAPNDQANQNCRLQFLPRT